MNCKGQIIIIIYNYFTKGFPGGSNGKNLPAMQETQVSFPAQGDPLEQGMVIHSSILAWRISQTEEPGEL